MVKGSLSDFIEQLTRIPGIGDWTAQYIAMRAMGEPDAFPAGDLGIIRALRRGDKRLTLNKSGKEPKNGVRGVLTRPCTSGRLKSKRSEGRSIHRRARRPQREEMPKIDRLSHWMTLRSRSSMKQVQSPMHCSAHGEKRILRVLCDLRGE